MSLSILSESKWRLEVEFLNLSDIVNLLPIQFLIVASLLSISIIYRMWWFVLDIQRKPGVRSSNVNRLIGTKFRRRLSMSSLLMSFYFWSWPEAASWENHAIVSLVQPYSFRGYLLQRAWACFWTKWQSWRHVLLTSRLPPHIGSWRISKQ